MVLLRTPICIIGASEKPKGDFFISIADINRVEDTESGSTLALRLHRADTPLPPEYTQHLLQLQQSLSSVRIRHLLQPLDAGWEEGRFWEVVEYVDGGTIGDLISAGGPFWPTRALDILEQIAVALAQLGVNAGECDGPLAVKRAKGRILQMGFVCRYAPASQAVRSMVGGGQLGRVYHAKASMYRLLTPEQRNLFTRQLRAGPQADGNLGAISNQ